MYLVVQAVFEDLDVVNVAEVGAQLGQLLWIFSFLKKKLKFNYCLTKIFTHKSELKFKIVFQQKITTKRHLKFLPNSIWLKIKFITSSIWKPLGHSNKQSQRDKKVKKHNFLEYELIIDRLYLFFKTVKMTFNDGA